MPMSQTIDKRTVILVLKRLLVYLAGLYLMAMGVVFSATSALGVSPVGSLANVLYQIGLSAGAPSYVNLGNCTIAVYCLYLLTEAILLRKNFKPQMLLQLIASLLFGWLVNLATMMLSFLPAPGNYAVQLLYLLCSVPLVAAGVMLYLTPNILPTPGDGMSLAIARITGLSVGASKTIFDCTMLTISAVLSFIWFHGLVGVREGSVICALLVGFVMEQFRKPCQKPLLRFVEVEDKVARALQAASSGYLMDSSGKPKVLITIGREFGAGGYEIGKLLAEKLGITFYDEQINVMASEQSGIPLSKIEAVEKRMERTVLYDFRNTAYAMTNGALSPEEEIYVARSSVIRQIASKDESCVIMGRCADHLLYHDPNCFRIFVHARPDARINRTMAKYGLEYEEAKKEMENTDRARALHYKYFTGREYGKQEYYHLGIDSGMLGTKESVRIILEVIKRWCDVRGTHPLTIL